MLSWLVAACATVNCVSHGGFSFFEWTSTPRTLPTELEQDLRLGLLSGKLLLGRVRGCLVGEVVASPAQPMEPDKQQMVAAAGQRVRLAGFR